MRVAILPARGGSKRIPRKNIKPFGGKPIIAWPIEAARQSGCFDRVIVSTDDPEIGAVAERYGAEVPFLRPAALSDDHSGTIPVIAHAIEWLEQQGQPVAEACCLYATAPFVLASDLTASLRLLLEQDCDYVFSATSYPFPIQRAFRVNSGGFAEMFQPGNFNTRSQDLEEAFHDAGQFYWGQARSWREGKVIFGPRSKPWLLPRHRVQDIDTFEDWTRAEWLFKALQDAGDR